jgi:Ca2+-dependent lipid-binding protein
MPGTVHVKVVKARDLPVMDKRSELTDAFVEIKMANGWNKTEVCPKTLHPKWNSQWYKFNVTDEELQDEPLQLK